jgi:MFS family permease
MRRPSGGLWGHRDFLKLWTGQSISELGSQVSGLAIPLLAAYSLHATPLQFSLLGVMGFLPFILFALPAGVWVDRLRRRYILIVGDAGRAVLLAIVPILWALHELQVWQLLVIEFLVGVLTVFFDVAYQSYLPALVEREHLIDGNSKLQLTASIAAVSGPPLAAGLMAAIGAAYAILADCASFVVSTVFMVSMRHREEPPKRAPGEKHPRMWPQVKEGLNWVVRHPWLRPIAICTGTSNFFSTLSNAILILYMARTLGLSKSEVAIVFVAMPVGSIVAGLVTNRVNTRLGVGRTILATISVSSVAGLCYPLAPQSFPLPVIMVGGALFGFGAVAYNITQVSLRQAITPERLQGRMNAAMRWIVWGTIPLGTLLGGAIATWFSLRAALWVGGIGNTLAILPIAFSSVLKVREMPEPVQEPTAAQAQLDGGILEPHPLPTIPATAAAADADA